MLSGAPTFPAYERREGCRPCDRIPLGHPASSPAFLTLKMHAELLFRAHFRLRHAPGNALLPFSCGVSLKYHETFETGESVRHKLWATINFLAIAVGTSSVTILFGLAGSS